MTGTPPFPPIITHREADIDGDPAIPDPPILTFPEPDSAGNRFTPPILAQPVPPTVALEEPDPAIITHPKAPDDKPVPEMS